MEVTDFLEVVILCLSLLIVIPILWLFGLTGSKLNLKEETDGNKERNNNRRSAA